jgi:hypothetical protein
MSTDMIPLKLLEHWIDQAKGYVPEQFSETHSAGDFNPVEVALFMLDNIGYKCRTWLEHQRNLEKMDHLNQRIMVTQRDEIVPITQGRLMRFKWYEAERYLILSHGWAMRHDEPRITFQLEDTTDLSSEVLVYQGGETFKELVEQVEVGGLTAIRNENNLDEWVPFE